MNVSRRTTRNTGAAGLAVLVVNTVVAYLHWAAIDVPAEVISTTSALAGAIAAILAEHFAGRFRVVARGVERR